MDNKTLWEGVLTRLAPQIGKTTIFSLFKDSIIKNIEHGVVTVGVPTPITLNFIRDRHEIRLLQALKDLCSEVKQLKLEVMGSLADNEHPYKIDIKLFQDLNARKIRKLPNKKEVMIDGIRSKMFNPRYTLDNFIPGQENQLSHAACKAVAAKPGDIYNPLFLYGDTGLGKTHLLQGVGLEILKNFPDKNVVYMTSERFMNEIVAAIGKKHTASFKEKYRKVDCFIVDDVQFFGNKASTQQEFFHTFNELYDAGKQIVMSSDKPPRELDGLEERLKSRFGMGMVVEVLLPDYETRLAILNEKCREHQTLIDPEVLEFIAFNVHRSVRELEGILIKTMAEAKLAETTPTIKSAARAIRTLSQDETTFKGIAVDIDKSVVVRSCDDVIDIVADYFKVPKTDLIGANRRKEVMVPRQISMYLIRHVLDQSYETIGESFSGRNHTTVLHAYNKIATELEKDTRIKRDVNALLKEMGV
ncbi:MAG: chromosomal replication initiator protein DnaA [Candidatus Gracilibacteria bacterium]|nr:chromosomal replication initiator protein DnaA [Candidatus Peregrinibacteria bacterium]